MKKRILIIDDDRDFTSALAARCAALGVDACVAHNPLSALDIIVREKPDLICLDVEMPTGDGLSIREYLGSCGETEEVPVVIVTGRKDPKTIHRCGDLDAHYVHKSPELWNELRPLITGLLNLTAV